MLCYPELGRLGRLGNHLFQIAATVGAAKLIGEPFAFPRWAYEKDFHLEGCFFDQLPPGTAYREPRYQYDPIPKDRHLHLYGFFQSERYFAHQAEFLRNALTPRTKALRMPGTASLHVRRGDYLQLPDKHPILGMDYYERAIEYLRTNKGTEKFLVFSDDLAWCRAQKWPSGVEVIKDSSPIHQLSQTIGCEDHILANSTFSWWGAWLNPNTGKKIVAPRRWYGEKYQSEFNTQDLFPPDWVLL